MTTPANTDPMMEAIGKAVTDGHSGNTVAARSGLLELWTTIGPRGDPLHRCTLAHYLADLYDDPAQALGWDVRALDAADSITEQRVQQHHASLHIAGFYPSLHLNLADNYHRLGSFEAAAEHIDAAREHSSALPHDSYGDLMCVAIDEVTTSIANECTAPRSSAPGPTA
ncbi:hypothetical protein [Rhodococcus marinonascens]|uniref:hypothetical protein n=1 Tax=Rhodococcus marinonascens TaxID=38311 RepID=UPI000934AEBA|nr:hypothetical protein [Rhodococcus marinonascens]